MKDEAKLYIVSGDILPDALVKTADAKDMIRRGEAAGPGEAARALGISRSTFYKYREGISCFFDLGRMCIANLSLLLDHAPGVLSAVLSTLASFGCNVLTINQGLPSVGTAVVTLSVGLDGARQGIGEILAALSALGGVADVKFDGINR